MVDGFISPRLKSPYHIEKHDTMSPELIIFDPIQAGIVQLEINKLPEHLPHISINAILNLQTKSIDIAYNNMKSTHRTRKYARQDGGSPDVIIAASDEVFQNAFIHKQKDATDLLKSAQKAATKWKKQFIFIDHYAKHPDCEVHDWAAS